MPGMCTCGVGVDVGDVLVPPVEAGGTDVAVGDGVGEGFALGGGSFVIGMWP